MQPHALIYMFSTAALLPQWLSSVAATEAICSARSKIPAPLSFAKKFAGSILEDWLGWSLGEDWLFKLGSSKHHRIL